LLHPQLQRHCRAKHTKSTTCPLDEHFFGSNEAFLVLPLPGMSSLLGLLQMYLWMQAHSWIPLNRKNHH
jgi:hypothetical protein